MDPHRRPRTELSRRGFVTLTGATGLAVAAGCDALSTAPKEKGRKSPQPAAGVKSKEAPDLAARAKRGDLPPLAQRIPDKPMVLKPVQRVGDYGGEWRYMLLTTGCITCLLTRTIGYENLVRWSADVRAFTTDELVPNIVEKFDVNGDATQYTLSLREGMRWSDGTRYTADDIMFWFDDVFSNTDLTPTPPTWLTAGGKPVVAEKVDDYHVTFTYAAPNGMFLQRLAAGDGLGVGTTPAHYLKQFHISHNPDAKKAAEKEGMHSWVELYAQKADPWSNPDLPVLDSWVLTSGYGASTKRLIAERNPYCWKTDSEGHQLPYLDRVNFGMISDQNALTLKAMNGEIDMQITYVGDLTDKPVFAKNRDKGEFHFIDNLPTYMNNAPLALNLTVEDPVKRRVFNDIDFRIGLSYALNRQEIIDTTSARQGRPFQCAPRPESPFYHERLATQYTEFDLAKANAHLDKVLPDKNSDGMRLGPDGKEFGFTMDVAGDKPPDNLELIRGYWKKVGIQLSIRPEAFELMLKRVAANQHDSISWYGDGGLDVLLDPRSYFPFNSSLSAQAIPWAIWYQQGGLQAEREGKKLPPPAMEPPAAAKEQMKLYDKLTQTQVPDEQAALMKQILDIAAEQFWMIGVSLPAMGFGIAKDTFFNVPKVLVSPGVSSNPGMPNSAQYFTTAR